MEFRKILYNATDNDIISILPNAMLFDNANLENNYIVHTSAFFYTRTLFIKLNGDAYIKYTLPLNTYGINADIICNLFNKYSNTFSTQNNIWVTTECYSFILLDDTIRLFKYSGQIKKLIINNIDNYCFGYSAKKLLIKKNMAFGHFPTYEYSTFSDKIYDTKFRTDDDYLKEITDLGIIDTITEYMDNNYIYNNIYELYEILKINGYDCIINDPDANSIFLPAIRQKKMNDLFL